MKIRNGFVSNSSSSSFIVAWKGELNEKNILKALDVSEKSPLYNFAKDLAEFIIDENKTIYENLDKYKKEYSWLDDDACKKIKEIFNKGFVVGEFSASYNEYNSPIEGYLGNSDYDFKIISDNFMLLGEGNY